MTALTKLGDKFTETLIDGEVVVMLLDSGEFFSLTETGPMIWQLIDGKRDRDGIVDALAADFAVDREEIERDVDEFIVHLRESGLVA